MYNQKYESGAAFWPDVHRRVIIGLIISQLLLIGLLGTKDFEQSTPVLLVLPVLTIWFHRFCKGRFEPAFVIFPLQVSQKTIFIHGLVEYKLYTFFFFSFSRDLIKVYLLLLHHHH